MLLKRMAVALTAAGVLGIVPGAVQADPLLPGTMIPGPSIVGYFGGTVQDFVEDCFANGAVTGCARSAVVLNGGTLDFYYQFTNTGPGDAIDRMTAFNFAGFTTDVFQISNGSAIGVANFEDGSVSSLSADRNPSGSTVGWNYANTGVLSLLVPGTTSLTFVIRTNTGQYTTGNYALIDGVSENVTAFAPTTIPEPATMLLLIPGIMGLAVAGRRRKTLADSEV